MSGFDGRIIFEGSTDRCRQLLGGAMKRAAVQRENKNILGLTTSIRTYDMGGGASCTISDLGYMRVMRITAPEYGKEEGFFLLVPPEFVGSEGPGVYDVLAGYTQAPIIDQKKITGPKGTSVTVQMLRHFKPTQRTDARYPSSQYRQMRLAVPTSPIFIPIGTSGDVAYSEHAFCKPANYSGAMRQVVQLLMGLGKVLRPTAEEKTSLKRLPPIGTSLYDGKKIPMVSAFGLYHKPKPDEPTLMARVDFDYRWFKTHGVSFDSEGVAWVIEIAPRGVHAMRLYMDPVSTTKEGQKRWLEVSPELDIFFALFHGIPIGFTVPTFEMFDKYKRAGEVVELISQNEMKTFYSQILMNTQSGWCFDDLGKEAHNTCYSYGADQIIQSSHFKVGVNVSAERFADWTPARSTLASMFGTLYEYNKCRRMTEDDAKKLLEMYAKDAEEASKAFDKMSVAPTLIASARLSVQRKGKLYHPAKFKGQPQIKFPEPDLGGLLSFDFSSADAPVKHKVKCDGPMYVCYIQNRIEVINYSYDNTKEPEHQEAQSGSTRQSCQAVGSWEYVTTGAGSLMMRGNFYSNRWDFRHTILGAGSTITKCTGSKLGADGHYKQDIPAISTTVTAYTMVHFWVECETHSTDQIPSFAFGAAVPFYDRCAYYFAMEGGEAPKTRSRGGSAEHYKTKISNQWQLYNFVWAWFDRPACDIWIDDGPLNCVARWRCQFEDENACFDDNMVEDMWLEACPSYWYPGMPRPPEGHSMIGSWARGPWYEPIAIPSSYSESMPDTEGSTYCDIYFVNDTIMGEQRIKSEVGTWEGGTSISGWWWRASPDDAGGMAYISATCSCLGGPVTNAMDDMSGNTKSYGFPESMFAGPSVCYTGVIE